LPFSTISPPGSDLTSLLLAIKDNNAKGEVVKGPSEAIIEESTKARVGQRLNTASTTEWGPYYFVTLTIHKPTGEGGPRLRQHSQTRGPQAKGPLTQRMTATGQQ
jgi:hypothetical protein